MVKPVKIPLPLLGVDLLTVETDLPPGAVRRAENVDIRADGRFKRRDGFSPMVVGADYHSLWSSARGVLVGFGTRICALNPSTGGLAELCDTGSPGYLDFVEYNGHTYVINEGSFWWIPADGAIRRVGVPLPSRMPTISASATGALPAGRYVVALSRVDDRGEESAAKVLGSVDLPGGGGVLLSDLEQSLSHSYRIYLTPPNGDALYLSEQFSAAFAEYLVTQPGDGAIRTTQHLAPMPAGSFVRWHAGRLYVARGDTLWFSEALRPHLHDPRYNFDRFVGDIRFIEPVQGGIFVADDRGVWWLDGTDPTQFKKRLVTSVRAIKRSSLRLPGAHFGNKITETDRDVAVWLSEEGYAVGKASGDVVSLHPERVRVAADLEGRSAFLVRDGIRQVITLVAATNGLGYGVAIDTTIQ